MEIYDKKENGNILTFVLKANYAFANALRRTLLSEIPTLAINEVDIYENSSSFTDEFIAHRLGLIPLEANPKKFKFAKDCCDGQCEKCAAIFALDVEGPGMIYSKSLKSKNQNAAVAEKKIPIIYLKEKQKLRIEGKAVLGIAKDHAKFQCCYATYRAKPILEIPKNVDKKIVDICPKKALTWKNNEIIFDEWKCIGCKKCEQFGAQLKYSDEEFLFTLESYNNIPPKDLLKEGLKILAEKASAKIEKG
ncbi:MAG: DNA-directed RNA polymerase subunit D [archaeon]